MTTEAAAAFAERVKSDEGFQSRLAGAASGEERLTLAREEGFDLSADDVAAVKKALGVEELSDVDLERVAGGIGATTGGTIILSGSVTAMGTAVAAAFF